MTDEARSSSFSIVRWVAVPVLITLAVTVLRVVGERNHWNPTFFSDEAGGQLAVIGIVWLVPIFGIYFALRLVRIGLAPSRPGKTILLYVAAALFMVGCGYLIFAVLELKPPAPVAFVAFGGTLLLTAALAYAVWPALGKLLFVYGLGARIPVAAVALIAILNNWQTHYDKAPPDFPELGLWQRVLALGVFPQLTLWIAFTMVVGGVFGAIAAALAPKRESQQAAYQG